MAVDISFQVCVRVLGSTSAVDESDVAERPYCDGVELGPPSDRSSPKSRRAEGSAGKCLLTQPIPMGLFLLESLHHAFLPHSPCPATTKISF